MIRGEESAFQKGFSIKYLIHSAKFYQSLAGFRHLIRMPYLCPPWK